MRIFAAALLLASAAAQAAPPSVADAVGQLTAREGITARQRAVPPQLAPEEASAMARIFADISAGRFTRAEEALEAQAPGLLTETARAELLLARGAGKRTRAELAAWLQTARDLPQAPRVAELALRLPATDSAPLPLLPTMRAAWRPGAGTGFMGEASAQDDAVATQMKPLLAADRNGEAELIWLRAATDLTPWGRAEWAQRLAWSHYGQNDNGAAFRLGMEAAAGAGPSAAQGAWTAGLAAWRLGRIADAARAFQLAAMLGPRDELAAAANFWAGRALAASGDQRGAREHFGKAAAVPNNFHGLLAQAALGKLRPLDWREPDFISADWNYLKALPGARRAAALHEIGQLGLADRELRHLAATAPAEAYPAILRLAARLDLPATQYSLAVRPPQGLEAPLSARYPAPDWQPARGWRVPRALAFAHALQESAFVTTATSRAGAKGLMQLMPATSQLVTSAIRREAPPLPGSPTLVGEDPVVGDLSDPAFNIEVGQTYLEQLRDSQITGGLLPKVIAAYNAGPGSVQRWNTGLDDRGDPLLFIESIPFRETRHYVGVVLRNLWMYELREGQRPATLDALVAGLWPRFPGLPGPAAVKLEPRPVQTLPSEPERAPRLDDFLGVIAGDDAVVAGVSAGR